MNNYAQPSGRIAGGGGGYFRPPVISPQQTQSVANNQMALGAQQAAQRTYAGAGLARGRGQTSVDANRGDIARANAAAQADGTRMQDRLANADVQAQYQLGRANQQLQYESLAEQARQSQWDSRFGNMTTAWGALAGLLR